MFHLYYPCVTADKRLCHAISFFQIFQIRAIVALISIKWPRARPEARRAWIYGTAPAKQARLRPCDEALQRGALARPRAGGGRGGSTSERKRLAIWIHPQLIEKARFVEERSLDFASPGFDFPS
jgi:hypothetical protein